MRRGRSSSSSGLLHPLLATVCLLLLLVLLPTPAAALTKTKSKRSNLTTDAIPTSDDECYFNYRVRRCEPVTYCHYKYRFLDATFGESCRLKVEKPHVKPLYKSKISGNPGLIAAGATALFGLDIAAILFTPLLQNFPVTFNVIQGM